MKTLRGFEKGWLAAAIDGEGTITLEMPNARRRTGSIKIYNTDKAFVEYGAKLIGIKPYVMRNRYKTKSGQPCKTCYVAQWRAKKTLVFLLPQIIPHLIVKKEAAMKLLDSVKKRRDVNKPPCFCGEKHYANGLCKSHYYKRWKRDWKAKYLEEHGETYNCFYYRNNREHLREVWRNYYYGSRHKEILAKNRERHR